MFFWNVYFLIKLGLYLAGFLVIDPWANFFLAVLIGAFSRLPIRNKKLLSGLQLLVFVVPATGLILQELGLVVSLLLVEQIRSLFGFSFAYLWELILRTVDPIVFYGAILSLIFARILDRYIRLTSWVAILFLVQGSVASYQNYQQDKKAQQLAQSQNIAKVEGRNNEMPAELLALGPGGFAKLRVARDQESAINLEDKIASETSKTAVLERFFQDQSKLIQEQFNSSFSAPDFDILFLNICSMSWSDLQVAKLTQHPFIRNADFIFQNFNSATSYSGPAVIRLMRGNCGQQEHNALFGKPSDECLVFNRLRQKGYHVEVGLNHDGKFQNFRTIVNSNLGGTSTELTSYKDTQPGVIAFDGSQTAQDGAFLAEWWKRRLKEDKQAVALYYNSITLHDGNKIPGSNLGSIDSYPIRVETLLNDMQQFTEDIKRSRRKVLLLVVPEHGAGLSGEFGQLPGLRELPTPSITRVPVVGYWLNPDQKITQARPQTPDDLKQTTRSVIVKQPVSYYALNEFLGKWLALPSNERDQTEFSVLLNNLPTTRFVSQQGNITVMESKNSWWLKVPGNEWRELGASQPQ